MAAELPSLLLITTQLTTAGHWPPLLLGDVSERLPTQQTEGSIKAADEGIKGRRRKLSLSATAPFPTKGQ